MMTSDLTDRTTTCPDVACPGTAPGRSLLAGLRSWLAALKRRREERRIIARLSHLEPRLLEDMGLDPQAIYDAVENTWDERPPSQRFPRV